MNSRKQVLKRRRLWIKTLPPSHWNPTRSIKDGNPINIFGDEKGRNTSREQHRGKITLNKKHRDMADMVHVFFKVGAG